MTDLNAPDARAALSQRLMLLAMQLSGAAQELGNDPASSQLSPEALAAIHAFDRAMTPARPAYMHPTAAAINADDATAVFAQVCAVRALKDALNGTELTDDGRRMAAATLLNELGTVQQVERAIADVRRLKIVRIPFGEGMRIMSKALILAAHHAREGAPLPAEGIDFVEHAARLSDQVLPEMYRSTLVDAAGKITVTNHGISSATQVVNEPVLLRANPVHAQTAPAGAAS